MSAAAIELVTLALRDRIAEALESTFASGDVFIGPLSASGTTSRRVVLFLYRVAVNTELRNQPYSRAKETGKVAELHEHAVPLDLHFLITPSRRPDVDSANESDRAELRDLGRIILALHLDPVITGRYVAGQTCKLVLEQLSSEEMSRLWGLFPTENYRTSVSLLVSPVWLVPELKPSGAPVLDETYATRAGVEV